MLDNNENVVTEVTENVGEQATEQVVDSEGKMYTDAELEQIVNERIDSLMPKKLERAKAKLKRDFEDKYEKVDRVLKAGLGVESLDEATDQLEAFYTKKGIKIPERTVSETEMNYLADKYADEIIEDGYEEIVREVDKLAKIGDDMTPQQKLIFMRLAEIRKEQEDLKELASMGVGKKELEDSKYQEFVKNLNPDLSAKEKYEIYKQYNPKPRFEQIGSMKSDSTREIKDFYTYEESLQFTREDLDKNPRLYEVLQQSMLKW